MNTILLAFIAGLLAIQMIGLANYAAEDKSSSFGGMVPAVIIIAIMAFIAGSVFFGAAYWLDGLIKIG
jgi:hypothetical protein